MELYERKNYLMDVNYIFNSYIREYDIKKANINILLYKGIIGEEDYRKLSMLSRMDRQISIGYILQDEEVNKVFEDGLKEIRRKFIEYNDLNENDILSIKNDAIYVINKAAVHTKFKNVSFICKNVYTSYMKLGNLEVYYGLEQMKDKEVIDVKGINESKLIYHKDYMLNMICDVLYYINIGNKEELGKYIHDLYTQYVYKQLPIEYYRTFDSMSMYNIMVNGFRYGLNHLSPTPENYNILDISYNAKIFSTIYSIIKSLE